MDRNDLLTLFADVAAGRMTPQEATLLASQAAICDLGYASLDLQRGIRRGVSEVIYGEGKTASQIAHIVEALLGAGQKRVIITRLDEQKADKTAALLDEIQDHSIELRYEKEARVGLIGQMPHPDGDGTILVMCAGTSDVGVAEEAAVCAQMLGNRVEKAYDVGIAGIHRLLAHSSQIVEARVIIAVAGMEGALPGVVAGLASCPVLAVPTSVGYGTGAAGLAALQGMLNSCSAGISVVNIDNGFGAAYQASLINHSYPSRHENS